MILDVIINIFTSVVGALVSLLPTASFSDTFITTVTSFINGVYAYDSIVPVTTMFTVFSAAVVFMGIVFLWRGIQYIIHLIRGN